MDTWQTVLVALGGNAALLAVLGWLAKSLVERLLTRDIEAFKARLTADSQATADRLRHELHLLSVEHQIRFSKLHERRAEVIAELYARLVDAYWAAQSFVAIAEWSGEPRKKDKYTAAMNQTANFYRYFDKHRIYLPEPTCALLEEFVKNMRTQASGFGVYVAFADEQVLPTSTAVARLDAWRKAWEYFENEVPKARAALEHELRGILGAK